MERNTDAMQMLDLMVQPGFCVQNRMIVKANQPALSHMVTEGTDVYQILLTGKEEYAAFSDGCLFLTLMLGEHPFGASVSRIGEFDVFILEQEEDQSELQAMALAARELREPLTSVMTTADRLFPMRALQDDPATREQVARINRGLLQMLRVISNMSDASRYSTGIGTRQETREICGLLEEIFARAGELVSHGGITLSFRNFSGSIYSLVDAEKLERAVLNIISNAMKFTPKGGTIEASLTRRENMLYLQIQDNGQGIPENLRGSLHSRYLRQPAIEDGRFGIGLGMVLIRSAAAHHGGTVLIDQPEGSGTRITMTLAIRQNTNTMVRSNILRVDYAGDRDHALMELADCLPAELYDFS